MLSMREKHEDYHIHIRPNCFSSCTISQYAMACQQLGIQKAVFLEHGPRISSKHRGILDSNDKIQQFIAAIKPIKEIYRNELEILSGVEIDYSEAASFVQYSHNLLINSHLDFVVGSVHGYDNRPYVEYLDAVKQLVSSYNINSLGHFKITSEILKNIGKIEDLMLILKQRDIRFECNRASRYNTGDLESKRIVRSLLNKYGISVSFGSDAHSISELLSSDKKWWFQ